MRAPNAWTNAWTLSLAISFIQGCSPAKSPDAPPPQKTVFDPLTRQLDQARGAQQTVDGQAERTRSDLDAQERGEAPKQ